MRKLAVALFATLFAIQAQALVIPSPKPNSLVHDFANVIPDDVEQKLEAKLQKYERDTTIELAVVTVDSLQGDSVEDFTQRLAQSWGVGKKQKNNGVVLLVAPNERKMRIEVGYGLEPDLTDGTAGQIIQQEIIPLFKQHDLAGGIVAGVDGILKTLGDKPFNERPVDRKKNKSSDSDLMIVIIAIVIVLIVLAVLFFANDDSGGSSSGGKKSRKGGSGYSGISFISLGSSRGSSSSGRSSDNDGGGGGGGFSFGGGSFGGGGASGSW